MENRIMCSNGMVVTPHHLATQSALSILRKGGTAIEATVAAAATIAVVYPHMNSIGGDGFWLIIPPTGSPTVIEGCGQSGSLVGHLFKKNEKIPYRGLKSALTVPGTVGGWQEALDYLRDLGYNTLSSAELLKDAIMYAEDGFPVSSSQEKDTREFANKENVCSEFERVFIPNGFIPEVGQKFYQKDLAASLKLMAMHGFNSLYRGKLAEFITNDLIRLGLPIVASDLAEYKPIRKEALKIYHNSGMLYNTPPPTQGIASLLILGILDKLHTEDMNEGEFIHKTVEATKQAFTVRDQYITDPEYMKVNAKTLLESDKILAMSRKVDPNKALPGGHCQIPGDTIWMGVMDKKGFSVSFIQSVYHSFGSGIVLPSTGILWHNRGVAFNLQPDHLLCLKPGKKPLHTLNPAAVILHDGRTLLYGTRGGDGQPQTQAAIFHRYVVQNLPLCKSISDPRWLYGRVAGDHDDTLKIENRFSIETIEYLESRGHKIELYPPYSEKVGHAGALVRHLSGVMEGASDPRSNGSAAGF